MLKREVKAKPQIEAVEVKSTSSKKTHLIRSKLKKIFVFIGNNKYWFLGLLFVLILVGSWFLYQSWMVQSYLPQAKTYSKVSISGINVGNLSSSQLDSQLAKIESDFKNKDVTLTNLSNKLVFKTGDLGISFDLNSTSKEVLKFNRLDVFGKIKLLNGAVSPTVKPILVVDDERCVKSISIIKVDQVPFEDASFYYDNGIKIKPDKPGTRFNPNLTCNDLSTKLSDNIFTVDINLDISNANITKAELEKKLPEIQSLTQTTLVLKSGSYQKSITPEQLLLLLNVTKVDSNILIDWSSNKLDDLINEISSKVNTSEGASSLGICQYVSSYGGRWLDKDSTKKIFTDLSSAKTRTYELSVTYHAPVISTRSPLNTGSKGTIFLTYDDGMTYGNQIMNYASCYGIKVTFFEIGMKAESDAVALRRAVAEGHAVQSHAYEHALYDYGARSLDWQLEDMNKSINIITAITGVRPTYFRPPGGNKSADTYAAAAASGLNLVMWGDASRDSAPTGVTSALTCNNVLAGAFSGATVLMHSTNKSTAEALPCIAEGLAARGYNMQALR